MAKNLEKSPPLFYFNNEWDVNNDFLRSKDFMEYWRSFYERVLAKAKKIKNSEQELIYWRLWQIASIFFEFSNDYDNEINPNNLKNLLRTIESSSNQKAYEVLWRDLRNKYMKYDLLINEITNHIFELEKELDDYFIGLTDKSEKLDD